ncbi:DMT family transporter [Humisphaera borealis]|uniref:Guanidinium exporter n=1 Tax=Humisphaera borealis TaxID=2807512 RepID=A0A7M2WSX9_9BACT|nr:multidrug efflux SMR transporter [Humisphaera borealis]QOV88608.1 multidrug efflux SMR transporter [Humisphaera borealis]
MAWLILILAGLLEIAWAFGLKKYGLSLSVGSAITVAGVFLSFWMLHVAMRSLPLGVAYPVWTGIGAIGSAIVGMVFLNESKDVIRIVCIILIVAGIVGLKVFSPNEDAVVAAPQTVEPSKSL